jgi:ligand-binding sensor domain-containing protein
MKIQYITLLFSLISQFPVAQQKSDWKAHLAYNDAQQVEEANNHVFVLADGALYSYSKKNSEIILYSRQNGLNDTEISIIRYSPDNSLLVIVYSNGNIDLLDKDGISNMPDLKNTSSVQNKGVYDIFFKENLAYLSTDFGITVLNLVKREVWETYKLDIKVLSACIAGEKIYAATENGIYYADTKTNLLDKGNWSETGMPDMVNIVHICLFNGQITVCKKDAGLYYFSPGSTEVKTLLNHYGIKGMSLENNELLAHSDSEIYIFKTLESDYASLNAGNVKDITSLKDDGKYWIAAGTDGLAGIEQTGGNEFTEFVSGLQINSPQKNYDYFMTMYKDDKLLITGGGRLLNRYSRPGVFMIYRDNNWYNFDENIVNQHTLNLLNTKVMDYMCVAVDPDDEEHYYIATYGEGVVEIKNSEFVNIFNLNNSTLESALPNEPVYNKNFVRIGSCVFDKNKNLWIVNSQARDIIKVLKSDGSWSSLYYRQISYADKVDKIMITSRGHKWVNVPYNNAGIFVFDDRGTIDDVSDDICNFFTAFKDAQNNAGGMIIASQYLSMAEDRTGTVWIGTNTGLLKCTSPAQAIDNPELLAFSRLVRDGDAYFLNGESVTAIAVDADNNKWIGTGNSGVFLINDDGSETIYDFTAENSPLLSNTIQSIAINSKTGEVFFGTDKGLVSFNSGIKSGSAVFSDVYAFPNPVRPDFNDKVTITGLSNNTNVKITDISGVLIYQAKAVGNRIVWNCHNLSGNRVATGIYLVIASTPNASESVVTKIAVVK